METPRRTTEVKESRQREDDGWRAGRPVEDPEKTKSWGLITAKPSEFLVHVRNGRVLPTSGQGASCFKWPRDAVAIVPTSLQRLRFRADQVTAEKVGVEVVGLAVFRIAQPLLAFRVLNFSFPERAQEKLEETLTGMFVGASRRLIATLSIEDCLTRRKSALAQQLLQEIAPVVGGEGRAEDTTRQGWGVVIDTIEIQEVRVLSEKVFASMQAPYRTALEQQERESRALAERAIAAKDAECRRDIDETKLRAEAVIAEQKRKLARELMEESARDALRKRDLAAEQEQAELAARQSIRERERAIAEAERQAQTALAARESERIRLEADAQNASHAARMEAMSQQRELSLAEVMFEGEKRRLQLGLEREEKELALALEAKRVEIEAVKLAAQARLTQAQKLPELAAAVGQRIGEVRIQQWGTDANPFGTVAQAVSSLMELIK